MQKVAGLPSNWVTMALMLFGVAGLGGSYLFSRYYDDHRYAFVQTVMIGVVAALLLLYPASVNMYTVILVCAGWGLAIMAFQVSFQAELIGCVSAAASSVAMAIFSGIFNLGTGCGTWFGGTVYTKISLKDIGFAGGLIVAVATLICMARFRVGDKAESASWSLICKKRIGISFNEDNQILFYYPIPPSAIPRISTIKQIGT